MDQSVSREGGCTGSADEKKAAYQNYREPNPLVSVASGETSSKATSYDPFVECLALARGRALPALPAGSEGFVGRQISMSKKPQLEASPPEITIGGRPQPPRAPAKEGMPALTTPVVGSIDMGEKAQPKVLPPKTAIGGRPQPPLVPATKKDMDALMGKLRKLPRFRPEWRVWMSLLNPPYHAEFPPSVFDLSNWEPEAPLPEGGKHPPKAYLSIASFDLGLCGTTFKTHKACELGANCPYRHALLTRDEEQWLTEIGARNQYAALRRSSVTPAGQVRETRWYMPS